MLIAFGTLYYLFKDSDLNDVLHSIGDSDGWFLLGGVAFMGMYVVSESVIMAYLFRNLNHKIPLYRCIFLSHIGFFFGAITPSASGGQPVQVFYMNRLGVDTLLGSLVVVIITLCFKLTLFVLNVLFFIIEPHVMTEAIGEVPILFGIGAICTFTFLVFLFLCIFKAEIADKLVTWLINLGGKFRILPHPERTLGKVLRSVRQYEKAARYIRQHLSVLIIPMLITIVQRLLYFSVTYLVVRSLHIDCEWTRIVGLLTVLSLSVDLLPLPGASGANESVFFMLFTTILSESLVQPALLINRGITYYLILVAGGIITFIGHCNIMKYWRLRRADAADKQSGNRRRIRVFNHYVSPQEFEAIKSEEATARAAARLRTRKQRKLFRQQQKEGNK